MKRRMKKPMTLRELWTKHYLPLVLPHHSPSTDVWGRLAIKRMQEALGRTPTVADLTEENLCKARAHTLAGNSQGQKVKRTAHTANAVTGKLLAMWRFAIKLGLRKDWPFLRKLPVPKRIPHAWTKDELRRIAETCAARPGWVAGIPAAGWWSALLAVLCSTGARISAVLKAHWSQVDFETGTLLLLAEHQKQKADQLFVLHPDTLAKLRKIQTPERELIFPWPGSRDYLWKKYEGILRDTGLPHDRRHKFHAIRKSVATYYEMAGGNATALLGHSARSVTEQYIDPKICKLPPPPALLSPLDDKSPEGKAGAA